jgi:outer membrane immunogenic protein
VQALPGLYWRTEYRYAAYGSADLQFFSNGTPVPGFFNHETKNVQTITTSLVWKFQTLAPAPAPTIVVEAPQRAPVLAATTWTGCYVNAGAGYGFFSQQHNSVVNGTQFNIDETSGGRGWLGTIGGGCDYQFNGNFVGGLLADYDFMDLHGHLGGLAAGGVGGFEGTEKESSAIAAGGRIGYLVTPQILTYINGGWSSTRFDGVNLVDVIHGTPSGFTLPAHTYNGGFVGGGTEIAVQSLPGLYWRSEYRLASYGSADLQASFNGVAQTGQFEHMSKNVQTITTSLVWKFH